MEPFEPPLDPPLPPRGMGNTGDLTNHGVKFPTTGAKSAVKSPLCPHPHSRGFDNTSRMTISAYFMHANSNKPALWLELILASAILLFRNAKRTENRSVNWTTVNCPRGGDKKQCQIPTWGWGRPGVGVGHEIDKCISCKQILMNIICCLLITIYQPAPILVVL